MISYSHEAQDTLRAHLVSMPGYCIRVSKRSDNGAEFPLPADLPAGDYFLHRVFSDAQGFLRIRLVPCTRRTDVYKSELVTNFIDADPYDIHLTIY